MHQNFCAVNCDYSTNHSFTICFTYVGRYCKDMEWTKSIKIHSTLTMNTERGKEQLRPEVHRIWDGLRHVIQNVLPLASDHQHTALFSQNWMVNYLNKRPFWNVFRE